MGNSYLAPPFYTWYNFTMKSKIAKVIIVPTKILEDRRIKIKVTDLGWIPLEDRTNKSIECYLLTSIECAINPDDIFCDWCEYHENGEYWGAHVKLNKRSKRTALVCYKKDYESVLEV